MNNIVIRTYPAIAAIAYVEVDGQFAKCLGEFASIESAARELKGEGRLFVEDCLFGSADGVPRYKVIWGHGAGTPDYLYLEKVEAALSER